MNRLDRLTSGLMVLARTAKIAGRLGNQISSHVVHKHYLARVTGHFPSEEIVVDQPIKVVSIAEGTNHVSPDGKPSKTIFKIKSYDKDSNTSIVLCILQSKPTTGRTHQIRIHLQYLGHPITNDPIYNNDPAVNKLRVTSDGKTIPIFSDDDDITSPILPSSSSSTTTTDNNNNNKPTDDNTNDNNNNDDGAYKRDPECTHCVPHPDPRPEDLYIYLHAFIYEGPDWHFETELPLWARESPK